MNLVFLGPPGAGKGTIAALVAKHYGVPHISSGELFRTHIKKRTELGIAISTLMEQGDLVPDSITVEMIDQRLKADDAQGGFILDGFPRTLAQAEALKEIVDITQVINFHISEENVLKRLSGRRVAPSGRTYHVHFNPPKVDGLDDDTGEPLIQRDDDKPEAILHRLEVYEEQTFPLIEYYCNEGLLVEIDAEPSPEVVFTALQTVLKE
ncbi:MAG: adenylate kinase [Sphaerochaeta sp.]|jgi:adenylate kinase|nr:adenylate kinase [Spirochaetales bacterium]